MSTTFKSQTVQRVPLSQISVNALNKDRAPDNDLVASIAEYGIFVPLILEETAKGKYTIIAGERRYKAAQLNKLKDVPAQVINGVTDDQKISMVLIDNLHRKQMNMYQEYQVINELLTTMKLKAVDIAKKLNKSVNYVVRRMNLGNLCPEAVQLVANETPGLTEYMVFGLAKLPHSVQKVIIKDITETQEFMDNGKLVRKTVIDADDSSFQRFARIELQEALFTNKLTAPEAVATLGVATLDVGVKKFGDVANDLFVEKERQVATAEQAKQIQQHVEDLKDATLISSSQSYWGELKNVLCRPNWRESNKTDDPKKIKSGIDVETGKLVSYVSVSAAELKAAEQREKAGVSSTKPLTPAEQKKVDAETEKKKAARRELIFSNKVENLTVKKVFLSMLGDKKTRLSAKDLNWFFQHGFSEAQVSNICRLYLTEDEYSKIRYNGNRAKAREILKGLKPEHVVKIMLYGHIVSSLDKTLEDGFSAVDVKRTRSEATKHYREFEALKKSQKSK
jgi:ParB/RepB/Spo0J family partition protein